MCIFFFLRQLLLNFFFKNTKEINSLGQYNSEREEKKIKFQSKRKMYPGLGYHVPTLPTPIKKEFH